VARLLTSNPSAEPEAGVSWIGDLVQGLKIPRLSAYGLKAGCLDDLVSNSAKASSMKANPIVLTREELMEILQRAL
jgi:alcohol dehydrogenase class IV